MESAAAFLAADAKQSWQHYITTCEAEKYLACISPAHFTCQEKNSNVEGEKALLKERVEPVATGDSPGVFVKEEWEVIDMDDVLTTLEGGKLEDRGVALPCGEKTVAECLVKELGGQMRGIAAYSALERYQVAMSSRKELLVIEGGGLILGKELENEGQVLIGEGVALAVSKTEVVRSEVAVTREESGKGCVAFGKDAEEDIVDDTGKEDDLIAADVALALRENGRGVVLGSDIGEGGADSQDEVDVATLRDDRDERGVVLGSEAREGGVDSEDGGRSLRDEEGVVLGSDASGYSEDRGRALRDDRDEGGVVLGSDAREGGVDSEDGGRALRDDRDEGGVVLGSDASGDLENGGRALRDDRNEGGVDLGSDAREGDGDSEDGGKALRDEGTVLGSNAREGSVDSEDEGGGASRDNRDEGGMVLDSDVRDGGVDSEGEGGGALRDDRDEGGVVLDSDVRDGGVDSEGEVGGALRDDRDEGGVVLDSDVRDGGVDSEGEGGGASRDDRDEGGVVLDSDVRDGGVDSEDGGGGASRDDRDEGGVVLDSDVRDGGVDSEDGGGGASRDDRGVVLRSDAKAEAVVSVEEGCEALRDSTYGGGAVLGGDARDVVLEVPSTEDHSSKDDLCNESPLSETGGDRPMISGVSSDLPEIQFHDSLGSVPVPAPCREQLPLAVSVNHTSSQTTLSWEDLSRLSSDEREASSPVPVSHASSQTTMGWEDFSRAPCEERGTSPHAPPVPVSHASSQTTLSCEDLIARAKEMKELELLKVELHVAQSNLNTERSQRQVSEELVKIVQTDVNSLTERNMTETMARVKVENELGDVKAEFSHTSRQLKESEERIQELEDTLKGTTLMVRKLEEQNASTLINRGGIDYMLQARLADGRAKEAEQKLQVLQAELLQSQGEVRMLLDRVGESSRDRAEMVSSKVHTQLMAIADEKVVASERHAQVMEREILELRSRLAHYEKDLPPHQRPGYGQSGFSGLTSSGLSGLSSYGSSGGGLGSGLTGLGGGLGGGLTGLGGGPTGYGGGLSGLGGGPTGYGGGPTGYGGGLTGLGGGLTGLGGAAGIGSGLTGLGGGLTGLGGVAGIGSGLTGASSYSPYSTYSPYSAHSSPALSSGLGPYAQQPPSLQEQYNLHTSASTLSSATPPSSSSLSHLLTGADYKGVGSKPYGRKATSPDAAVPAPAINGGVTKAEVSRFELPSFNTSLDNKAVGSHVPPPSHDVGSDSDWSSSDEDEEAGKAKELKPSTHSSLIAEWEWRAMKQDQPASSAVQPSSSSPNMSSSRKPRPPVAPKPTGWHVSMEPSSSFDEPIRATTLPRSSFRKPQGPSNRQVPRRWRQSFFPFN